MNHVSAAAILLHHGDHITQRTMNVEKSCKNSRQISYYWLVVLLAGSTALIQSTPVTIHTIPRRVLAIRGDNMAKLTCSHGEVAQRCALIVLAALLRTASARI